MSAPGPESVPTSADPKSHRPIKRRALTPVSAQAASVDALFAKPDQEIRIPVDAVGRLRAAPPEIVTNVQGSSAGAGSGEFHVYKASRRREYERLKEMDEQVKKETDQVQFDKDKAERIRKDEERTRKNREKREKMKARRANKGKNGGGPKGPTKAQQAGDASQREDGKEDDDQVNVEKTGNEPSKPTAEPVGLVIHDDD